MLVVGTVVLASAVLALCFLCARCLRKPAAKTSKHRRGSAGAAEEATLSSLLCELKLTGDEYLQPLVSGRGGGPGKKKVSP